jgi:hypothetical protein
MDHGRILMPDVAAVLSVAGAAVAVRRTSNAGMALAVGLPIYWVISACS